MSETQWRYALASVVGSAHIRNGLPCQDKSICETVITASGDAVIMAAVSDGAGSASKADIGAEVACTEAIAGLRNYFSIGGEISGIDRLFAEDTIKNIQTKISERADAHGVTAREFACTLLVAVAGDKNIATWQVGDGVIVYANSYGADDYSVMNWPEKDEYENVTVFVTQDSAVTSLMFDKGTDQIDEIAILSDGIQRLALDFSARSAFSPFFRDMFKPLRSENPGMSERGSEALTALLKSAKVNSRTDDDKTLILASRRSGIVFQSGVEPASLSQLAMAKLQSEAETMVSDCEPVDSLLCKTNVDNNSSSSVVTVLQCGHNYREQDYI